MSMCNTIKKYASLVSYTTLYKEMKSDWHSFIYNYKSKVNKEHEILIPRSYYHHGIQM